MDAALIVSLEKLASAPRLARYRAASNGDLETAILYFWNGQLAESLYPGLATLEIALRNAAHNALTLSLNTDFWFKAVLQPKPYQNLADMIDKLTKRIGHPPTSGKLVSELSLGFWVKLFARHYNSIWWDPTNPFLASVIPSHPKIARDTRSQFATRLDYFHTLRNRVMHHEAIFQGIAALNRPVLAIDVVHAQLLETIGWINADAATAIACMDRFTQVHDHGKVAVASEIRSKFGIP